MGRSLYAAKVIYFIIVSRWLMKKQSSVEVIKIASLLSLRLFGERRLVRALSRSY